MGLGSFVRKTAKQAVLAGTLLAATAGASVGLAADQYLSVITKADGVGGTAWKTEITLQNPSTTETISGAVHVLPGDGDDRAIPYSIQPRGSVTLEDPIGQVGLSGNAAAKITHFGTTEPGVTARFWNEQDHDGDPSTVTELSQYLAGQSVDEFLQPGDVAWLTGPDVTITNEIEAARQNVFFVGTANYKVEKFNDQGAAVKEVFLAITERDQKTDFSRRVFGMDPQTGDTYKFTVLEGSGWFTTSNPQNNQDLPGYDDAGSTAPLVDRLVKDIRFVVAPEQIEENDPFTVYAQVTTRDGTTVSVGVDSFDGTNSDTNQATYSAANIATVAGTYEMNGSFIVTDENNAEYGRALPTQLLTVVPEQTYEYAADDVNDIIMANKTEIAKILSHGVYTGDSVQYPPSEWERVLDLYQDGVEDSDNMEAKTYKIWDSNNLNHFEVIGNDNRSESVVWHYEADVDRLRQIFDGE